MDKYFINRRNFLKLLQLFPFILVKPPDIASSDAQKGEKQFPNILIIIFDALSATNLLLYGYPRQTTPNLTRIASQATVFNRHYAGGNFTSPGTGSLFTGSYPWSHRALHVNGRVNKTYQKRNIFQLFQEQYQTFSYSHNAFTNILLDQFKDSIDDFTRRDELCLHSSYISDQLTDKDFAVLSQAEENIFWGVTGPPSSILFSLLGNSRQLHIQNLLNNEHKAEFPRGLPNFTLVYFTIEDAVEWIKQQVTEQSQPFMGYVHLYPPHYPYNTRQDFVNIFDDGWRPKKKPMGIFSENRPDDLTQKFRQYYDEYIAYVDAEFARLFEFLERSGTLDNTYLIFSSDHGEMFERGILQHGTQTLYEPIIRIPLIIWSPGQKQRIDVNTPTSCVDLLPTLLYLTGKPIPSWCEGEVLPPFKYEESQSNRSIFVVEAKNNPKQGPLHNATIAHIKGDYKLIYYFGYDVCEDFIELYDIKNDPDELNEISLLHSAIADEMKSELLHYLRISNSEFLS